MCQICELLYINLLYNIDYFFRSVSIIGAYCAIDRQYFNEVGEFDDGMLFWGGENIDLSLRVRLLRFYHNLLEILIQSSKAG